MSLLRVRIQLKESISLSFWLLLFTFLTIPDVGWSGRRCSEMVENFAKALLSDVKAVVFSNKTIKDYPKKLRSAEASRSTSFSIGRWYGWCRKVGEDEKNRWAKKLFAVGALLYILYRKKKKYITFFAFKKCAHVQMTLQNNYLSH